jgi:hypothetical protein
MKIFDKIENMFPRYISEEYPIFTNFIKEYYKFLDSGIITYQIKTSGLPYEIGDVIQGLSSGTTATIYSISEDKLFVSSETGFIESENFEILDDPLKHVSALLSYAPGTAQVTDKLLEYRNIDSTPHNNIQKFFREFMAIIPYNLTEGIDKRKLLKEISDLYRVKGTEASIKILFRIISNSEANVYYPSVDILKVSDGKPTSETGLKCKITTNLETFSESDIGNVVGREAKHANSSGIVERVIKLGNDVYEIILIENSIRGTFENAPIDPRYENLGQFIIITGVDGSLYQFELLNVLSNKDVKIDFNNSNWATNNLYSEIDPITIKVPDQEEAYFPNQTDIGFLGFETMHVASIYKRADFLPTEWDLLLEDNTGQLLTEGVYYPDYIQNEEYSVETIWPINPVTYNQITGTWNPGTAGFGNGWHSTPEEANSDSIGNHLYRIQICMGDVIIGGNGLYPIAPISPADPDWGVVNPIFRGDPHLIGYGGKAKISTITSGIVTSINSITSGGTLYAKGDIITISSDPLGNESTEVAPAKAIVKSVDSSGIITDIELIYGGQGFQKFPDLVIGGSNRDDNNAVDLILGHTDLSTDSIGCISEITITDTGQDYSVVNKPTISIHNTAKSVSSNINAILVPPAKIIGKLFNTESIHLNTDGFISEARKKIRDGYYYQEYSYVVKTKSPIQKWSNILKASIHPAGLIFFGEFNISSMFNVSAKSLGTTITTASIFAGGPNDYGYITPDDPILYNLVYGDITVPNTMGFDYSDLT